MPSYIPAKGDFVILSFDPQAGHEQKGATLDDVLGLLDAILYQ